MLYALFLACATSVTLDGLGGDQSVHIAMQGSRDAMPGGDTGEGLDSGTDPDLDADGDGWTRAADCDDADPAVYPEAPERCDGVDNDCDGGVDLGADDMALGYLDADGDGWGAGEPVLACDLPSDAVEVDGDCDDTRAEVYPGAPDDQGDTLDNDCDGTVDEDYDACALPSGTSAAWTEEERVDLNPHDTIPLLLDLDATICAVTCDAAWLSVQGVSDSGSCSPYVELPYVGHAQVRVCVRTNTGGSPVPLEGTCSAYTSQGTIRMHLVSR